MARATESQVVDEMALPGAAAKESPNVVAKESLNAVAKGSPNVVMTA